jgi:thiol-disulfide isomerase/thioredoxin
MKTRFFSLLFCLLFSGSLCFADKVITNPAYEFSNSGISHVSKIELTKTETRLHIHEIFLPHWWVRFSDKSYIEDCATGKKYQIVDMKGGKLGEKIFMPDSGDSTFVLIFPPLEKSVKKINYADADDDVAEAAVIYGISLNPKEKQKPKETPKDLQTWIDGELDKARRKTLMDIDGGEFFANDTARIIGYIKGYDPRAGFSTGIVYASNELTRESYPIVIQIHSDGRFEGDIPMIFPKNNLVSFNHKWIDFYLEPGQTLFIGLDWEDFLLADRNRDRTYKFKNIEFQGVAADINRQLNDFALQMPAIDYNRIINNMEKIDDPDRFRKKLTDTILVNYLTKFREVIEQPQWSPFVKKLLKNDTTTLIASYLSDYADDFSRNFNKPSLPAEYYDYLQQYPMNDKTMMITNDFRSFINRFEYSAPLTNAYRPVVFTPEKDILQYLFEELNLPKSPEDEEYIKIYDKLRTGITTEEYEKYKDVINKFYENYEAQIESYRKKYVDIEDNKNDLSVLQYKMNEWRAKDSVYTNVLKLKPGILYEVVKVRSLKYSLSTFTEKDDARKFLTYLEKGIKEPFLIKEAERLYKKAFPSEPKTAYDLPNSPASKQFKEIIAPFKGKILLVDFWATTCGPCVYNIKEHKELREKWKNSEDFAFLFITATDESPESSYNKFVEEQELTNTWRVSADEYRYFRQLFRFNGIPHYVLVDREGRIIDDAAQGWNAQYIMLEELEQEKKNP